MLTERKRVFATAKQMAEAIRKLADHLDTVPGQMTFDAGTIGYFDYGELRINLEQKSFTQDGYEQSPNLKISLKTTIKVNGVIEK